MRGSGHRVKQAGEREMPEGMIRTIKTRWQQEAELAGRSERHNGIMRRVGWMDERQVRLKA